MCLHSYPQCPSSLISRKIEKRFVFPFVLSKWTQRPLRKQFEHVAHHPSDLRCHCPTVLLSGSSRVDIFGPKLLIVTLWRNWIAWHLNVIRWVCSSRLSVKTCDSFHHIGVRFWKSDTRHSELTYSSSCLGILTLPPFSGSWANTETLTTSDTAGLWLKAVEVTLKALTRETYSKDLDAQCGKKTEAKPWNF